MDGPAAEQAKALLADARLVSAFQTVSGEPLQDIDALEGDVLVCGADAEARATVGALIEDIPNLRWATPASCRWRGSSSRSPRCSSAEPDVRLHDTGIALTGRDAWGAPAPRRRRNDGGTDAGESTGRFVGIGDTELWVVERATPTGTR